METSWDLPWVIAIHEAGHAVAAWALGLELIRVTIAEGEPGATYDNADDPLRTAQATAAGPIAQCLFASRKYRCAGWQNDRRLIVELFMRLDDDIACIAITRPTFRLVNAHEGHVRALADKLLERVEIPGAEAKALLDAIERRSA